MLIPRPKRSSLLLLLSGVTLAHAAPDAAQMQRGAAIYAEKCLLCHQATGLGTPPVFPPLAESEWFTTKRTAVIKALCEGLAGPISVRGQTYQNVMPPQVLDDAQVADVLTFAGNSWGNLVGAFSAEEVAKVRATSRFKTFDALVKASTFQPLPKPPAGYTVREVVQLPENCTRLASTPRRAGLYVLALNGGVHRLDPQTQLLALILKPSDYLDAERGGVSALGCTFDESGRLWIVTNQKLDKGQDVVTAEVVIWRSSEDVDGLPGKLQPWHTIHYPQGFGGFNHGVSQIAFGPDGMLYLASGSRTDAGEASKDPRYPTPGEVELTACIWRLDPQAAKPEIEVYARGLRNAYALAWNPEGVLFSFSNGPDYSAPEEVDVIERGRHYGFPYQFADLPVQPHFPYPHTPPPPDGVIFTRPVANLGPAGGGKPEGLFTLDAHSSPGGVLWCGDDFPPPLRGRFLVPRFGNLLGPPAAPEDVGFDVLSMQLERRADGTWVARTETVLAPLGRPLDTHRAGPGRAYILEYSRATNFKERLGTLPGRIIELSATAP